MGRLKYPEKTPVWVPPCPLIPYIDLPGTVAASPSWQAAN